MAKKLYSTDEARAIILAPNAQDTEEDIDASDYGENSDFEDETSSNCLHYCLCPNYKVYFTVRTQAIMETITGFPCGRVPGRGQPGGDCSPCKIKKK